MFSNPFNPSMILLHNIVEILDLSDFDGSLILPIVLFDSGFNGTAFVDCDFLRASIATNRFDQEALGSLCVSLLRQ